MSWVTISGARRMVDRAAPGRDAPPCSRMTVKMRLDRGHNSPRASSGDFCLWTGRPIGFQSVAPPKPTIARGPQEPSPHLGQALRADYPAASPWAHGWAHECASMARDSRRWVGIHDALLN